jgi:hypothetical protein
VEIVAFTDRTLKHDEIAQIGAKVYFVMDKMIRVTDFEQIKIATKMDDAADDAGTFLDIIEGTIDVQVVKLTVSYEPDEDAL